MRYKSGINKNQDSFLPSCLDDYVGEEHICRIIDAFTDTLDMTGLGFKYAEPNDKGCRPYNPRLMLNLYIYGYLNRIRSSRRLEAETLRNVEVMWLIDKLTPDDRTICNFRKDNSASLKATFREFSIMCRKLELFGGEVVAIDGTKIRASNNYDNNFNEERAKKTLTKIEKSIADYMKDLDEADKQEASEPKIDKEKIQKALKKLQDKKNKIEELKPRLKEPGGVSIVDQDARMMKQGGDAKKTNVCYNVQSVVDNKNSLVVDFEITNNGSDLRNLKPMTDSAKEILGVEKIAAIADKGYYDGADIVACEKSGVTCYVPRPDLTNNKRAKNLDPQFGFNYFNFDVEKNCFICPMGKELYHARTEKPNKRYNRPRLIYTNKQACKECCNRAKCINSPFKEIHAEEFQRDLVKVNLRTKNTPELVKKRKQIVEHPFGTIKKVWGFSQFLCRTNPKVRAEMSLTFLAYNLRRVLTLFSDKKRDLITKMQAI